MPSQRRPHAKAKCLCGHDGVRHTINDTGDLYWCIDDCDTSRYPGSFNNRGSYCVCSKFELAPDSPIQPIPKQSIMRCKCGDKWRQHTEGANGLGCKNPTCKCKQFVSEVLTSG